jgi:hypothetical protein
LSVKFEGLSGNVLTRSFGEVFVHKEILSIMSDVRSIFKVPKKGKTRLVSVGKLTDNAHEPVL